MGGPESKTPHKQRSNVGPSHFTPPPPCWVSDIPNWNGSPLTPCAVVGLTGGIGSGKSSVSRLLAQQGLPIIDADVLAREVVAPGTPGLTKIIHEFGGDVLQPDGTLDRQKLGSIVFTDEAKRKKLNAIVHPAVRKAMAFKVAACWLRGERICVVDVPLLIEAGLWQLVGKVVVVYW